MMMQNKTQRSYQMSAIQGASSIGLIIVLLDTLVRDLRRAAAALRKNDIETRCRELNHASLVLGQLENWLDKEKGGESAQTLTQFYAYLRAKMMEATVTCSATVLETQIDMVLQVRSAWQKLDNAPPGTLPNPLAGPTTTPSVPASESKVERVPFSQSG
jgi:flagellar secretion chaperone FliS